MKKTIVMLLTALMMISANALLAEDVGGGGGGGPTFQTEVINTGTNAAAFLEIGVGARAMGMGGAYVAIANDPTALYYNPAGIVWIKNTQIELMHNEWLVDTNYEFLGLTMPMPFFNSTLGASLIMLDYGEQPVRTESRPEGTGENYSARDYAVAVSFASALTNRFSFGITAKYINQSIWHVSGGAAAMDAGIFYSTPVNGLRLGMSISNFGGELQMSGRDLKSTNDPDPNNQNIDRIPVNYETHSYPLPQIFRAGVSYTANLGEVGNILLTTDVLHPSNSTESINLGVEYGYAGMFFVRAGYENLYEEDSINGLTFGGGIDYFQPGSVGFRVDYAYSDWGILNSSHRFSVGIMF
ncbi:MAG: PorV/PorQ family protein [Calditrichia bacterium]